MIQSPEANNISNNILFTSVLYSPILGLLTLMLVSQKAILKLVLFLITSSQKSVIFYAFCHQQHLNLLQSFA